MTEYRDAYGSTPGVADGFAKLHLALVQSVNVREHTLDVMTLYSHKSLTDVPFASTYCHPNHGGGMYFMPEVGSYAYVAESADGTNMVMGFLLNPQTVTPEVRAVIDGGNAPEEISDTVDAGPDNRGQREHLEPGDIYLGTIDGNHVIVRRGGMVQIGATGLAQRVYLPVENLVRDYFQRYQAYSPVGEIEWGHAQLVEGETPTQVTGYLQKELADADVQKALSVAAETPVMVRYNIKDLCQEDTSQGKYTVELRVGRLSSETLDGQEDAEHVFGHSGHKATKERVNNPVKLDPSGATKEGIRSDKGVLSFTIYNHDPEGTSEVANKVNYALQLSRDGDALLFYNGHVHTEIDKTAYVRANKGIKVVYGGDKGSNDTMENKQSILNLLASNEFEAYVKSIMFDVLEGMDLKVKKDVLVQAEGKIQLGRDTDELQEVVRAKDLKDWFTSTFATLTPAGAGKINPACLEGFEQAVGSAKVKAKK